MNIPIYVEPSDFAYFLQVSKILQSISIENDFTFNVGDITWEETFNSNFIHVSMDVNTYLKWRVAYERNKK